MIQYMNRKTVVVLLLLTLVILVGTPESFARPQYLANLTAVYGGGSCGACHVMASGGGPRDFNGTFGQHNPDGTVPRNPSRMHEQSNSSRTFGGGNRTFPLNSYGTLFENQPDHATDPSAALMAIGQPPAATATPEDTPAETTARDAGAHASPGFGVAVTLIGLFVCAVLARSRNNWLER